MNDIKQRLDFAVTAAQASSQITLDYFGQSTLNHDDKADGTPVTIADRACESDLRNRISAVFPDDSILGEEFERKIGTNEYEWVIDPIDGTISFIQGVPLFGTMLACMHKGKPVLGVITMPVLNETVYAAIDFGCWHTTNGGAPTKACVSSTDTLTQSLVNTTSMSYFETDELRKLYTRLDTHSKHTRGWSDCYGFVLLATGRVDAIVEPVLSIWDFAAAIPIITEAGGVWSDFSKNQNLDEGEIIACNPGLLPQIQSLLDNTETSD